MKSAKPPPAPDYAALAQQQAVLNKEAATEQTVANRPTQNTPWGSTSWAQGPDGQWTQNVTLDPAEQAALDQQRQFSSQQQGFASGLLDQAGQALSTPLSLDGLPQMQGYDMSALRGNANLSNQGLPAQGQMDLGALSAQGQLNTQGLPGLSDMDLSGMNRLDPGFGAVESVRNAMMSRLAPQRQQGRNAEIQRLKNQGIPENSEAFQRALTRLDQGDTDAQQQALLGAASEYGNIFNRGLSANNQQLQQQQAIAALRGNQRGQLFNEQGSIANLMNQNRGQQFVEQGAMADLANRNRNDQFSQNQAVADFDQRVRGQQFNEQGQQAQLAGMLRQQSLAEQDRIRQSPMNDFLRLTQGINPTMPQMPSFMAGTGYNAADMAGAGQQQYQAQMNAFNANQARNAGLTSGLFGLAGSALGGPMGGMIGSQVGGLFAPKP